MKHGVIHKRKAVSGAARLRRTALRLRRQYKRGMPVIATLLIMGLNATGLSAVSRTVAMYMDDEASFGNTIAAGSIDFALAATPFVLNQDALNLQPGKGVTTTVAMTDMSSLPFQYKVHTDALSGDVDFCNALNLGAEASGTSVFNGPLNTLQVGPFTSLTNWTMGIALPSSSSAYNKSCGFNLTYDGWQTAHNVVNYGDGGFSDTESVTKKIDSWGVRINKVYYDVAADRGSDSANEWVELYNQTDQSIDLTGWKICDDAACVDIPGDNAPIAPNGYAVVTASSTTWGFWNPPVAVTKIVVPAPSIGDGLSNVADEVLLKRPDGVTIDQVNWGAPDNGWANYNTDLWNPGVTLAPAGGVIARSPNGFDTNQVTDWVSLGAPTVNLITPDQAGTVWWYWWNTYGITWTATNPNGPDSALNVALYYIQDTDQSGTITPDDTQYTITDSTENDGDFQWQLPGGFLGYIWIKIVVTGPENPMLTNSMISGKIWDPFPMQADSSRIINALLNPESKDGEKVGDLVKEDEPAPVSADETTSSTSTEEAAPVETQEVIQAGGSSAPVQEAEVSNGTLVGDSATENATTTEATSTKEVAPTSTEESLPAGTTNPTPIIEKLDKKEEEVVAPKEEEQQAQADDTTSTTPESSAAEPVLVPLPVAQDEASSALPVINLDPQTGEQLPATDVPIITIDAN